jgi:hypothetical protein
MVLDGVATNQTPQFTEGFQVFQKTSTRFLENLACSRASKRLPRSGIAGR